MRFPALNKKPCEQILTHSAAQQHSNLCVQAPFCLREYTRANRCVLKYISANLTLLKRKTGSSSVYDNELFWEQTTNGWETWRGKWSERIMSEGHDGEEREKGAELEKLPHTNLTEEIFYRDWQPFLLGWPHQSLPLVLFCSSSLTMLLLPLCFSPF